MQDFWQKEQALTGNSKEVGHLRGQFLIGSISDGAKQNDRTAETSCNGKQFLQCQVLFRTFTSFTYC